MENNFLELIRTRRSCRHYKPEQITDEELHAVLEAGTYAPTSRGLQSPYIVAVQNILLLEQLAQMNASVMGVTSNPYYDAPTYVLVFVPADAPNGVDNKMICSLRKFEGVPQKTLSRPLEYLNFSFVFYCPTDVSML